MKSQAGAPLARRLVHCVGVIGIGALLAFPQDQSGRKGFDEAHTLLRQLYEHQLSRKSKDPAWFQQLQQETQSTLPRVKSLVDEGILDELNRSVRPPPESLERNLDSALAVTGGSGPPCTTVITQHGVAETVYVVAYCIAYWGDRSLSSINVYGRVQGKYTLLTGADDPLPNRTISLALLPPTNNREVTFLAYGINWGDPHNHLKVVAYRFDGQSLHALLSRSDLVQGQVKVTNGKIQLDFLAVAQGPGYPPAPVRTETYRVTNAGIELEKTTSTVPE